MIRRTLISLGFHVNKFLFSSIQGSIDLDYISCFISELEHQKQKLTLNRSFAALKVVVSKLHDFVSKFDEYLCTEFGKKKLKAITTTEK